MQKWPWIERTFQFDFPASTFHEHLERLRGTPARIEDRIRGLPQAAVTRSDGKGWSIQENIGHLHDLEGLQFVRIEQILAGQASMSAADMSNQTTQDADHNARKIDELLSAFRHERERLVARFEELDESDWEKSSLHPRLQQPMRIVDLVCFNTQHDDYHLARIGELVRTFANC